MDKVLIAKQKKSARMKEWYYRTHDIRLAKDKEKRARNHGRYNKYSNDYRKKNPRGIYDVIKQGAKRRSLVFTIDKNEFVEWYKLQPRECFYCKRSEEDIMKDLAIIRKKMQRLSIDRVENEKGYETGNLILSCMRCNYTKSNFFSKDEMLIIGRIIKEKFDARDNLT